MKREDLYHVKEDRKVDGMQYDDRAIETKSTDGIAGGHLSFLGSDQQVLFESASVCNLSEFHILHQNTYRIWHSRTKRSNRQRQSKRRIRDIA